jgi:membrane protease YdiL (CAAX protease family)
VSTTTIGSRSLRTFVLLELILSIPFWGIGALATAGVIPDQVMIRASWSLTPMIVASILIHRQGGVASVVALYRRIVDVSRIRSPRWLLVALLAGPVVVLSQYGLALVAGSQVPAPQLTPLVLLSYLGLFLITPAEELGWTGYVLDAAQERWSALGAALFTGVLWASMHAPVWLLAGQSPEWCLWQMLYVVAMRVLMTWVYNNVGRSLFAMDLLHPGMFVWWYLWPVTGSGVSVPSLYDPRSLALVTIGIAAVATWLWGSRTLAQFRFAGAAGVRPVHVTAADQG